MHLSGFFLKKKPPCTAIKKTTRIPKVLWNPCTRKGISMEPELPPATEEPPPATRGHTTSAAREMDGFHTAERTRRDLDWGFIGPHGLRAGWSVLLFAAMYYLFREVIGTLFFAAGLIHDIPVNSAAPRFASRVSSIFCAHWGCLGHGPH